MMNYLLYVFLSFFSGYKLSSNTYTIEVHIEKLETMEGMMYVCLMNPQNKFIETCFMKKVQKVIDEQMVLKFYEIPIGQYAVSVFHDENDDGKLNTGFLGIPNEPYGFSNNPVIVFGSPNFEDCSFQVDKNKVVEIVLK